MAEELEATRTALGDVKDALTTLAKRTRTNRVVVILLAVVFIVVALIGAVTLWEHNRTNDRLRDFGRNLFLTSCESTNDGRELLRQNNIEDAELLILVTGADQTRPDLAEQYRELVRQQNSEYPDRDCAAELEIVEE